MSEPPPLEVGRITRAHGLRGEVVVDLWTNREERLEVGSTLLTERGPLVVSKARKHSRGWVVAFQGVQNCEAAEDLRGLVLEASALEDADALWVHELLTSEVYDVAGKLLGVVTAVEANPASDLLVLDSGGLIPLRFVTSKQDRRVVVDIPAGLLD